MELILFNVQRLSRQITEPELPASQKGDVVMLSGIFVWNVRVNFLKQLITAGMNFVRCLSSDVMIPKGRKLSRPL